jgi:hypothetical protein
MPGVMKKLFLLVGFCFLSTSNTFAHNGEKHKHAVPETQSYEHSFRVENATFNILIRSGNDLDVAHTVLDAVESMIEKRFEHPRFNEALEKSALQSIVIEPKVMNTEGQDFLILVVRTQKPGRVNLLVSSSQLRQRNLLDKPEELIPILAKEFSWVVSKADTAAKPKTVTTERDLQNANVLNDQDILKMSGEARVKALRSLFDSYLRTVDEQKSLENQSYYEEGSDTLHEPSNKESTVKFYDIRIRQALEKIVSDAEFLKKYPRAVQSLLNGKIWNIAFVRQSRKGWG